LTIEKTEELESHLDELAGYVANLVTNFGKLSESLAVSLGNADNLQFLHTGLSKSLEQMGLMVTNLNNVRNFKGFCWVCKLTL
jgi:hypothetical protein